MNLNPALKSMANDEKSFKNAAPMLFGDEFAKLATERVDQLKAISKFSKPEQKKSNRFFLDTTPKTLPGEVAGWEQKRPRTVPSLFEEQQLQTKPKQPRTETVKKFFSFKLYANRHSYRISPYWVQNKRTEHDIALNKEGYSSYGACRSNQVVHSELAPDNTGSVGSGNGPGISTPSLTNTSSVKTSSRNPPGSRSDSSDHDS